MSVPSWAKCGVKVVCIDPLVCFPNYTDEPILPSDPVVGGIYTINWVGPSGVTGATCLMFVECVSDACWDAACFRPLVTKTQDQDIALFRHHLDGVDA